MAVTIAVPPATDPAYLAFLRSTGIQESDLSNEAALRISTLNRGLQRRMAGYAVDKQNSLQDTANDWENRGLYRSGARLVAQQRAANAVDRTALEDAAQTGDQIGETNYGTAAEIARLRRAQAENELSTRTHLGTTLQPYGVA